MRQIILISCCVSESDLYINNVEGVFNSRRDEMPAGCHVQLPKRGPGSSWSGVAINSIIHGIISLFSHCWTY